MKKALRLFALSVCLIIFLFASCDQNSLITHTPAIRGSVTLPAGTDIKGSDFNIRIMDGETAVYTGKVNADGSFVVEGLDETKTYSILLSTEELGEINTSRDVSRGTSTSGYGGWLRNVTASIDEQAGVGSVKVKPLGTIKGKVKRLGETEHYDIMVYIPGTSYMAVTDAEGNYSIFNVPQSTTAYNLRCISITGDWLPETITGVLLYVDNDTENPVRTVADKTIVKNAGTLLGTITKPGATDNSNITVLVENNEVSETGTTNIEGNLQITGIVPGTYKVTISSTGFVTRTIDDVLIRASKDTSIGEITLTANGGDIIGYIAVNDNASLSGALITATSADKNYSYTTSSKTNGEFIITNAYPTTYDVLITKTGYADIEKHDVTVRAGQSTGIGEVILSSEFGTLKGIITDNDGNPLEGVSVMIGTLSAVTTDAEGVFIKSGIPIETYKVSATKDGYTSQTIENVTVLSSTITELQGSIVLTPLTGTIYGRIRIDGESDLSGVKVTVTQSGTGKQYYAYTEQDGSFSISATAGNYNQVEFTHSCCSIPPYNLENIALFANGTVEIKPKGSNSSAYQIIFNHNYGVYETQASTCTEQGYNKKRCWNCLRETIEYLDLLEHSNTLVDHQDPTCTEDGWNKYECSLCGQTITEELHATGHNWSKPVVLEVATCHSTGSQKISCSVCGAEETQTIEKLPHSWVDKGYADGKISYECSICGETEQFVDSTSILNVSDWGSVSLKPSVDPDTVKTLIIPSEIDGITVTSVFEHAFQDCVNITKVILPDTLTSIESWAFAGCIGITEIDLPTSLTRIGDQAFRGCSSLKSIEIPIGIETIEYACFYNCENLVSVSLPDSIRTIGRDSFSHCGFDRFHIPESVESIECYAFAYSYNLKEILIPRSVKYVDDRPFWDCTSLSTIYVAAQTQPSGWITSWHDCCNASIRWGFTGELHYVHIESGEWNSSSTYHWHVCTECGELMSMEKHVFASEITKESTCTETGVTTYTCSVCGWNYTETIPALGHDYHSEITKQATCTEKGEQTYTCSRCDASYTEDIVSHHEYEEEVIAVATCTSEGLKTLTCSICGDSKTEVIPALGHSYKEIVVAATCTEGGLKTFTCKRCGDTYTEVIPALGHNYVPSITKQATCEEDGIKAFTCSRCGDAYTEEIPALGHYYGSTTITRKATCTEAGLSTRTCLRCGGKLTEEIPATGHTVVHKNDDIYHWTECKDCGLIFSEKEEHSFVSTVCTECGFCSDELYFTVDNDGRIRPKDVSILPETLVIPSVVNGKKVTKVAADSFRDLPYVKHLIISDGIEVLEYAAFMGSSLLATVSLPATISRMEYGGTQFGWCDNLDSIVFSGTMEQWKRIDFGDSGHIAHNNNITRIICSDGIIDYSDYFANADGCFFIKDRESFFESEFTVPSVIDGISITGLSGDCFSGCSTLESITIPEGVTRFLWRCFNNCNNLREVILPESLSSLGADSFANCISLETISLPESLSSIGERAFQNCIGIQSITLPSTIDAIPEGLFDGATNLTEIIFEGTVSQWNALSKGSRWCKDVPATKVVCSDGEVEMKSLYVVGKTLYSDKSELLPSNLEIPSNLDGNEVKILSSHLFDNDYHFTSIIIPEGITTINSAAFRDCQNVTSITLPSTVTSIADDVFCRCKKLEEITIPSGIKIIERAAFYDCDLLSYVSLPDSLLNISNDAFAYCESLESITIPNKVNRLGGSAFAGSGLVSVDIPNSVTTLEGGVFQCCSNLESVSISANVTEIPQDLFREDTKLTSIFFNGSMAKWNSLRKGAGWNSGVPATKVVCIDGKVSI